MSWQQFEDSVRDRWTALADEAEVVRQMGERTSAIVQSVEHERWALSNATLMTGRTMVSWKHKRLPCMYVYLVVYADLCGHISSDNDGGDLECEFEASDAATAVADCMLDVMDMY